MLYSFSCFRGHPKSRVLSERSRAAAKPSFGQKDHHFTPTLGLKQPKGKNRTALMKAHTADLFKSYYWILLVRSFNIHVENHTPSAGSFLSSVF